MDADGGFNRTRVANDLETLAKAIAGNMTVYGLLGDLEPIALLQEAAHLLRNSKPE
jgi:hypothetical protein